MLDTKSIVELRGIAQSMNVPFTMADDKKKLIQAIQIKQDAMFTPPPAPIMPDVSYHALRSRTVPKSSDEAMVRATLQPFVDKGLHLSFHGDTWSMIWGGKTDSGTLKQPIRVIIKCAQKVMTV